MKYVELSFDELGALLDSLGSRIELSFKPDLVIYLANGGFLVGKAMSEYFNVPLLGSSISRTGNATKSKLQPLLIHLPKLVKLQLRRLEMTYRLSRQHEVAQAHFELYPVASRELLCGKPKVLIADDSIDTGASVRSLISFLENNYPELDIKVAVLNVFKEGRNCIDPDWAIFENCLLSTPTSKDNLDYRRFCQMHMEFLKSTRT